MAPCSAKELVQRAGTVLGELGLPSVQLRTLRFYITKGVVAPPIGSLKFARYEFGHLQSLVLARVMQNQGLQLSQIKSQVQPAMTMRERKATYGDDRPFIDLTSRCRLELADSHNMEEDLKAAEEALKRILVRIGKEEKWSQRS